MQQKTAALFLAAAALSASQVGAFYLPGVVPKQFLAGEKVPVKVNSLTSIRTHLPYDYYKLPFCKVPHPSSPSPVVSRSTMRLHSQPRPALASPTARLATPFARPLRLSSPHARGPLPRAPELPPHAFAPKSFTPARSPSSPTTSHTPTPSATINTKPPPNLVTPSIFLWSPI